MRYLRHAERFEHSTLHDKKSAGARPSHALQESPTVYAIFALIVNCLVVIVNSFVRHGWSPFFHSVDCSGRCRLPVLKTDNCEGCALFPLRKIKDELFASGQ